MPPTTTGTSPRAGLPQPVEHGRHELHVRAGQHRQADAVHVLVDRGRDDLRGGEPDALVDDLEAGVARPHRHLLGAVGVPVEPGLADQQPQPPAELLAGGPHRARAPRRALVGDRRRRPPTRRRRSVRGTRRTTSRSTPRPLPRRHAGAGARERGRRSGSRPSPASARSRCSAAAAASRRAGRRPARSRHSFTARGRLLLDLRVDGLDRGVEVGGERVGLGGLEAVDADDDVLAALDPRAGARRARPPGPTSCSRTRRRPPRRPARRPWPSPPGRPSTSSATFVLDDVAAGEQVVVLEQVGLERQHLLDAAATTAGPTAGAGPSASFQAGSWTARARASLLKVTASISSTMRWTLFSGCASVRPERVDLHAVAEPARLGVLDAVALARQLVPQLDEGAHLAHLLDEPHAGVDEEGDPRDDVARTARAAPARCRAPRPARRSRWTARRRSPAPASPRPPAGGSCRC